jgi:hypothetical protein
LFGRLERAERVVGSLQHVGEKDRVVGLVGVVEIICSTDMKDTRGVPESPTESSDLSIQVLAEQRGKLQPAGSGGRVQVDETAASAAYGQEGVRARAASEVLTDGDRFGIVVVADEAPRREQHNRELPDRGRRAISLTR